MSWWVWLAVAAIGAIGAPLRVVVDTEVMRRVPPGDTPWGTTVINLSGSLVLGLVTGLGLYHAFPATPRLLLGTALCGSFTTFSTFTYETAVLGQRGEGRIATVYVVGSMVGGCLAAAAGLALAAL
jgi:CrcB protein